MRITEDCINHNAVRLIDELTSECYGAVFESNSDSARTAFYLLTLGNIIGVLDMAQAMKDVLKS